MKAFFILSIVTLVLAACSKGRFETVPQVKIDSFGPSEVAKGQLFRLVTTVTDKEGDLQNEKDSSLLIVRKTYLNNIVRTDTIPQRMLLIPTTALSQYEMSITFKYGEIEDNTIFQNYDGIERKISIGVIVVDRAGNKSEYVESEQILLKKL